MTVSRKTASEVDIQAARKLAPEIRAASAAGMSESRIARAYNLRAQAVHVILSETPPDSPRATAPAEAPPSVKFGPDATPAPPPAPAPAAAPAPSQHDELSGAPSAAGWSTPSWVGTAPLPEAVHAPHPRSEPADTPPGADELLGGILAEGGVDRKRIPGILRSFARRSPDDIAALEEILRRWAVPYAVRRTVTESWAEESGLPPPPGSAGAADPDRDPVRENRRQLLESREDELRQLRIEGEMARLRATLTPSLATPQGPSPELAAAQTEIRLLKEKMVADEQARRDTAYKAQIDTLAEGQRRLETLIRSSGSQELTRDSVSLRAQDAALREGISHLSSRADHLGAVPDTIRDLTRSPAIQQKLAGAASELLGGLGGGESADLARSGPVEDEAKLLAMAESMGSGAPAGAAASAPTRPFSRISPPGPEDGAGYETA